MHAEIDRVDWSILGALSDDFESIVQILPFVKAAEPTVDQALIENRLSRLLALGLIVPMEPSGDWYGMTEKGCEIWETHSAKYSPGHPDWSQSCAISLDFQTGRGFAVGVSRGTCESAILNYRDPAVVVDLSTFKHSAVDSFSAKYYKRIKGGHRIEFGFTRREPRAIRKV